MARVAAFIANGGRLVRPHFARQAAGRAAAAADRAARRRSPRSRRACAWWWRQGPACARGCRASRSAARPARRRWWPRSRLEKTPTAHAILPHGWFIVLRARRPSEDRARGAGRARGQRRRGGGARGARILGHFFGLDRGEPPAVAAPATRGLRSSALGARIDRRLVYNVDWVLLGTALLLSLLGTAMVYSATHAGRQPELYLKQLALVGVGSWRWRSPPRSTTAGSPTARCCSTCCRCWRSSTCCASGR